MVYRAPNKKPPTAFGDLQSFWPHRRVAEASSGALAPTSGHLSGTLNCPSLYPILDIPFPSPPPGPQTKWKARGRCSDFWLPQEFPVQPKIRFNNISNLHLSLYFYYLNFLVYFYFYMGKIKSINLPLDTSVGS